MSRPQPVFQPYIAAAWLVGAVLGLASFPQRALAEAWSEPVRGSWVQVGEGAQPGDVVLAGHGSTCEIVVDPAEHSAVKQAAVFLAADIERISGSKPPIVGRPSGGRSAVRLATLGNGGQWPARLARKELAGQWEAYQVLTEGGAVWLMGSDFRGTAYASYTLSERLGVDPLYLWTGYEPARHANLVLRKTDYVEGPPTFKYRGFYHDDDDLLPRPFDENAYPLRTGTVPNEWYARFFETALRLRMNMVAPYGFTQRHYEVQKMAGDWGLYFTSYHYDILLSNPWGFTRYGLAAKRDAGGVWDWFKNRRGMLNYWRGGVLENRDLDCIWPVGLRATQDGAYQFPADTSTEEKNRTFQEVIAEQVRMTRQLLPPGKDGLFTFILYNEMIDLYRQGGLSVPDNVIIVWSDDHNGHMEALPKGKDRWKHGVYYHLASYSRRVRQTKNVTHTVNPILVAQQFRPMVDSGATEYMMLNVSELRDFVMEARMIAEISWNSSATLRGHDPAARYIRWWAREYFGHAAIDDVVASYYAYYRLLDRAPKIWYGSSKVLEALDILDSKFLGGRPKSFDKHKLADLEDRDAAYRSAMAAIARAGSKMDAEQKRYFYENATVGLLIDWRQTQAALCLLRAAAEPDLGKARSLCFDARDALQTLEAELRQAERPPFEGWYRKTWQRNEESPSNVHRSYAHVQAFLMANFLRR